MTEGRHTTSGFGSAPNSIGLPVSLHEICGPLRLTYLATWPELIHPRFDVHDWSSVNGVEASQVNIHSNDSNDPTDGNSQAVRTILGSLSKDPDFRPFGITSRMA